MILDLDDIETRALLNVLVEAIEADRYPLSPRIRLDPGEVRRAGAGTASAGKAADTRGAGSGTSAATSIGTPVALIALNPNEPNRRSPMRCALGAIPVRCWRRPFEVRRK